MHKTEFVAELAKRTNISQDKAAEMVTAVLDIITDTLKAGDKVTLTGFGSFEVRNRAARTVTDIRTKQKRQTPASKHPAFSAGSVLKEAIHPKVKATKAAKTKAETKTKAAAAPKAKPAKGKAKA